jgi:hypothetical protein
MPRHLLKMIVVSGLAVFLALGTTAYAANKTIDPRAIVIRIADLIEANYFDVKKAKSIADDLKSDAAKGKFDALTDPQLFSSALTDRLAKIDGHFHVFWDEAEAANVGPAQGPDSEVAYEDMARRANYWFSTAEVRPGNVGYLRLDQFADFDTTRDPNAPARSAADAAMALLANTDALIIDLQNNGGGAPSMVGYLASYFVKKDADIYNTFKSRGPDAYERPTVEVAGKQRLDEPVYILTSARTGSAAESFAYTLQAAGRATVVGETSAGAANPGGTVPVGDGFTIFISMGTPINPITKSNWEGTGVVPQEKIPAQQAEQRAEELALTRILKSPQSDFARTDTQWALDALVAAEKPATALNTSDYTGDYGSRTIAVSVGHLVLRFGRRPETVLVPLQRDLFFVAGSPNVRVQFERDSSGKVIALDVLRSDGDRSKFARS